MKRSGLSICFGLLLLAANAIRWRRVSSSLNTEKDTVLIRFDYKSNRSTIHSPLMYDSVINILEDP